MILYILIPFAGILRISRESERPSQSAPTWYEAWLAMVVPLFDDLPVPPVSLDDLFEINGLPILQFQTQQRVIETSCSHYGHITDCVAAKRCHPDRLSECVQSFNSGLFPHDG